MGKVVEEKIDRIKKLNDLLVILDSPKEGDEIIFTVEGDNAKYRGIVKKKIRSDNSAKYQIVSKTKPTPKGKLKLIEYKGKVFNMEGKNEI